MCEPKDSKVEPKVCSTDESRDCFRDTWVRFMGYSNEVGEAFRPIAPGKLVRLSYAIAFGYVLADTVDKGFKRFVSGGITGLLQKDGGRRNVLIAAGDALLWQTMATIIIPGITINRIVHYSGLHLKKYRKIPAPIRGCMTVCMGLASIPVIVVPIDLAVTLLMDLTYRRWYPIDP